MVEIDTELHKIKSDRHTSGSILTCVADQLRVPDAVITLARFALTKDCRRRSVHNITHALVIIAVQPGAQQGDDC